MKGPRLSLSFSFLLSAFAAEESLSDDYLKNPDNYYRNPCPIERPGPKCNALDEYVWRKDDNYKWELIQTYTDYPGITGYALLLHSQQVIAIHIQILILSFKLIVLYIVHWKFQLETI